MRKFWSTRPGILYLDTTALVKLYLAEEGTELVERAVEEARGVATSVLSHLEAKSAFARLAREGHLSTQAHRIAVTFLEQDLPGYHSQDNNDWVRSLAGDLAEKHGLGALGALHLATALFVPVGEPGVEETVAMLTFDERLEAAAREEMLVYEV